ncbi:hypothetical protein LEZ33_004718, partial [Salmonella enterica subsp. enterica serovar Ouakam]|nr:hypothetical protein [Salmonella enterica subsp. enterica serovar Ouakam]EIF6183007.1 hypothetical protein [Salmonella enterica subsp. enterica serovar Ouakam]
MHRIDTPTAQKDKFGQGKNGFTNGDPATGRRATDLNSDMWDAVQEEVCTVIEAAGIPLSKGEHTQLHAAIGRLIDEQVKTRLEKNQNGADIPNKPLFLQNVGLVDVLFKGDGRFLAGTFVSDAIDRTSIGARAATGCQFMRAHQAPDAPDQVSFWQIITLSEVVSPTTVVDVLAISGNNVLFGHGTGAGITSWRHVAMLEGAAFTGDISAPNMRGSTSVTVGDGTGGIVAGSVDGAGFNGNNLNIKSWNGIGFLNSSDGVTRAYISTKLGVIAASDYVYAGDANLYKNGDVYGNQWSTGSGPSWLSLFLAATFPSKTDVSVALAGKPDRVFITHVGVYNNDKTKPFMLHDDGSGVFLATTDML